jgi:hypothetical protein
MSATNPRPQNMRAFLVIWFGELISMLGSGLTSFALGVWIYEQTGKATPFALTVLFGSLPAILLAPVAGPVVDRYNRKLVMILADTGAALVTLAAVILLMMNALNLWSVYLIALFGSVFAAFQEPAYQASVTMLVPKKDLTRASGLSQTGQALQSLVSPALAGVLYLSIGLKGVIFIDFATYFFAVGALLITHIPQPAAATSGELDQKTSMLKEAIFGWNFLRVRRGLFSLLIYFALVNFLMNLSAVLISPLVLSFGDAGTLGVVETVSGIGMLLGSLLLSAWGGPKKRLPAIVGFISLSSVGLLLMGVRPSALLVSSGFFLLMFNLPLSSGTSQVIFQNKVAPEIQGRVFAIRSMISRSMMPLAFLLAGPLADQIFEPAMRSGGWLAVTAAGEWLGTGAGRGIGVIFILSGMILLLVSLAAYLYPPLRHLERDLPDCLPEAEDPAGVPANIQEAALP